MKKFNLSLAFVLLLLLTAFTAQAQFSVTQDHRFKPSSSCFGLNLPTFQEQDYGVVFKVVTITNHNISSTSLASNLNGQCNRYMHFDIYDASGPFPVFETRITKNQDWLQGAALANATNRYLTTNLTITDLDDADLYTGKKLIRFSVEYDYFQNTPYTIALNSWENGSFGCIYTDITTVPGPVTCNMGDVKCFNYSGCDADLNVTGSVTLEQVSQGGPSWWQKRYDYDVNVTGGSGNYSYQWSVNFSNTLNSYTSNFNFGTTQKGVIIYLWVTDNVTGCTYLWNSNGKNNELQLDSSPLTMTVAPNPATKGSELKVVYHLPEADAVDFDVYDLSGKQVQSLRNVQGNMGENTVELQSWNLPKGIYFVKMNSEINGPLTSKLIVQ